jgi:hypothetical protein
LLSEWREGLGRLTGGSIVSLAEDLAGLGMTVSIVFDAFGLGEWERHTVADVVIERHVFAA